MSPPLDPARPLTRRQVLLAGAGGLAAATALPGLLRTVPAIAAGPRTTVQLLGTLAGQDARLSTGAGHRAGSALVVQVDSALYLVDAGPGALLRLLQAGYEIRDLRHLLVTRHTIDHNADLGTVLLLAWSSGRNSDGDNANRRLGASGPPGTELYGRNLRRQQALSIYDQAHALGQTPPFGTYAQPHDILASPGRPVDVYADDLVKVTAHATQIAGSPALAYRIKTPDRDIVFTGTASRRVDLAGFADGADTLIHEVIDPPAARRAVASLGLSRRAIHRLGVERRTPAAAADVAARAAVQQLVLAGLLPGDTGLSDEQWTGLAAGAFGGKITVGRDELKV
jgi:ribonuclease BN (tRNA processing enzyme)